MVKTRKESRIEIWGREYINRGEGPRLSVDEEVVILQIEPGNDTDDYIVEIIDEDLF